MDIIDKGWFGSLLGLVGILLAIYFYVKGKVVKKISYQSLTSHVIGGERAELPDAVKVTFNNIDVPLVSKTTIVLWNDGNTIINGTDLTENDPLRIELPEKSVILEAKITKITRTVLLFNLSQEALNANLIYCEFDFLDKNDGVRIEVLHTSEDDDIYIKGTVKGIPNGVTSLGQLPRALKRKSRKDDFISNIIHTMLFDRKLIITIFALSGIILFLFGFFQTSIFKFVPLDMANFFSIQINTSPRYFFMGIGVLYTILPLSFAWSERKKFPHNLADN